VVTLRPEVAGDLERRGIVPGEADTVAALRERLNDLYLEDVRRLRDRQRAGEIPLREYAGHVDELKRSYPLLGLPAELWVVPP
jgi:hypothetical protein